MTSMSVCMDVHISICTHVCDESKGYMSKCACLHANGCIHSTICLRVCIYVYMCASVYVNTCNILMMPVCLCINACTYKYICV